MRQKDAGTKVSRLFFVEDSHLVTSILSFYIPFLLRLFAVDHLLSSPITPLLSQCFAMAMPFSPHGVFPCFFPRSIGISWSSSRLSTTSILVLTSLTNFAYHLTPLGTCYRLYSDRVAYIVSESSQPCTHCSRLLRLRASLSLRIPVLALFLVLVS